MRIACVIAATELDANPTDVIVFPEGVNASELFDASAMHPESVIIGAVEEVGYSRAIMLHDGANHVSYLKMKRTAVHAALRTTGNSQSPTSRACASEY